MLLRGNPLLAEAADDNGTRLAPKQVKLFSFALRTTLMHLAQRDLEVMRAVSPYDHALISIATRQLALSAVKAADGGYLRAPYLRSVHERVEGVWKLMADKPQLAPGSNALISLNNMELGRLGCTLFSYCDRLLWKDVRGKEGAMQRMPKQLAVDLNSLPTRVTSPAEILDVLRQTEVLCLQLSSLKQACL